MRARTWVFFAAVAPLAFAGQPAVGQALDFESVFARWNSAETPGCAIGVERGKTITSKAFGMADLEHGIMNKPETVFEAGSVSKQFTAAAILLLAQEGRLRLDDDVRKYLPELPHYGKTITIDHLLTHTSGLRDWGALGNLQGWGRTERVMTQADVLALVARQRGLNFEPGAEYNYSNSNYTLMATIVERVSGQSFEDFTRHRMFEPLNMRSTRWRTQRPVLARAIAYDKSGGGYVQQMPTVRTRGEGGLLTTVGDLLLWNRALTEHKLGEFVATEFERQGMLTDGRRIRYARGLRISSRRGVREVSHAGATSGYRAWLARFPDAGISVAVLCNASDVGASATNLGFRVVDQILPPGSTTASKPAVTTADPAAHQGMFVNQRDGLPLVLKLDGKGLKAGDGTALVATSDGRFRMGSDMLSFEGRGQLRIADVDGNLFEYRRTEPVTTVAAAPYLGRYSSDEVGAAWLVLERDGALVLKSHARPAREATLLPVYKDVFLFDTGSGSERDGIARFKRDAQGRVIAVEIGWGIRLRGVRLERVGD